MQGLASSYSTSHTSRVAPIVACLVTPGLNLCLYQHCFIPPALGATAVEQLKTKKS